MNDFLQVVAMCKCEVILTVNSHRGDYESLAAFLDEYAGFNEDYAEIPADVRAEMIARDTLVHLQFYPRTTIGSYSVIHFDVNEAVRIGLQILTDPKDDA
jgi:hypothetical protein